jgi:hypothetical protein
VGKEVKGQKNRGEGAWSFIHIESGTGPVRTPYPKRGGAVFHSPDRRTKIIYCFINTLVVDYLIILSYLFFSIA